MPICPDAGQPRHVLSNLPGWPQV